MVSKFSKKRIKATIFSYSMLISVIGGLLLQLMNEFRFTNPTFLSGPDYPNFLNMIYGSHTGGGFDIFAPVLAVLPASTLLAEDFKSGFARAILLRLGAKRYIIENMILSGVCGGIAILTPTALTSLYYIVFGSPLNKLDIINKGKLLEQSGVKGGLSTIYDGTLFENYQYICDGLLIVLFLLVLAFSFGAIWSGIGLTIGAYTKNKYFALVVPFSVYFTIFIVFYRVPSLLIYSPVNMLMPDILPSITFVILYHLICHIMIFVLGYFFIRKRIFDV